VIVSGVIPPDTDTDRSVALPQGQYHVVVDNSPYVGQAALPALNPFFEPVAHVSYLFSMGDALDGPRWPSMHSGIAASLPWRIDSPLVPQDPENPR
jgi:hypothetical protein